MSSRSLAPPILWCADYFNRAAASRGTGRLVSGDLLRGAQQRPQRDRVGTDDAECPCLDQGVSQRGRAAHHVGDADLKPSEPLRSRYAYTPEQAQRVCDRLQRRSGTTPTRPATGAHRPRSNAPPTGDSKRGHVQPTAAGASLRPSAQPRVRRSSVVCLAGDSNLRQPRAATELPGRPVLTCTHPKPCKPVPTDERSTFAIASGLAGQRLFVTISKRSATKSDRQ